MAYKGVYSFSLLKNVNKIVGCDPKKLVYRSLWERSMIEWCDANSSVLKWGLESVTVKYMHPVRQKMSKYIIDFYVEFDDGREMIIEVKPNKETKQPILTEAKTTKSGKPNARFKREIETYMINQEKWRVAKEFASNHGFEFFVFDEFVLNSLGIRLISPAKADNNVKKILGIEHKQWRKKPSKSIKRPTSSKSAKKAKPKIARPKRPKSTLRKKSK